MFRFVSIAAAGLAIGCIQPAAAQSADPVQAQAEPAAFGDAATLDEGALRTIAGREDTGAMIATANQRNTVSNNSVSGTSTTGNVQIDGNAFQNLQGLAVISANSGNNVAINSAMNVTISMSAPQ
jgi:hypothetical protein